MPVIYLIWNLIADEERKKTEEIECHLEVRRAFVQYVYTTTKANGRVTGLHLPESRPQREDGEADEPEDSLKARQEPRVVAEHLGEGEHHEQETGREDQGEGDDREVSVACSATTWNGEWQKWRTVQSISRI